jgi:hypothetical protein
MALHGSTLDWFEKISAQLHGVALLKTVLNKSRLQRTFEAQLSDLTDSLLQVAAMRDAELSLRIERICIGFERAEYAITKEDVKRLDKQVSKEALIKSQCHAERSEASIFNYLKSKAKSHEDRFFD